jgi:DNA-binding XRE family transcriptional regulator
MEAVKIRNLHVWGIHQVDLAKMLNVSKQTIYSIIYNGSYTK